MRRWYVARTQPGLARVAAGELDRPYGDRRAHATLLPLTERGIPVFGSYIFIEIDLAEDWWAPINGVRGIVKLLPMGMPEPSPLPPAFVGELRRRMEIGAFTEGEAAELLYAYVDREAVRVTSGVFEGHEGKFIRRRKGFINVSMMLFNQPTVVPIPAHQVTPASPRAV